MLIVKDKALYLWKEYSSWSLCAFVPLCSILCLIFAFPLSLHSASLSKLNANHDFAIWLEQNIFYQFKKNWIFHTQFQERWGAHATRFNFQLYGAGIYYDASAWIPEKIRPIFSRIAFGPGCYHYRLIIQRLDTFPWVWVRSPNCDLFTESFFRKWRIIQRFRFEYLNHLKNPFQHDNHLVRRYRLEVFSPWQLTSFKLRPYIWNEWFYRKNTFSKENPHGRVGNWYQVRFQVGLEFPLFKKFIAALFWQWLFIKQRPTDNPHWKTLYQCGLRIDLAL